MLRLRVAAVAAVLVLLGTIGSAVTPAAAAARSPGPSDPSAADRPNLAAAPETGPSGSLAMSIPGPSAFVANGSWTLTVELRFEVENGTYDPGENGLTVRVPGGVALFATTTAALRVARADQSINVSGPGWNYSRPTSYVLPLGTVFNGTTHSPAPALLSSQGVAVMTPDPWDSIALLFEWEWTLSNPTQPTQPSSGWQGAQLVTPAEYAELASTSPHRISAGQTFDVCLAGEVSGREFGLVAENTTSGEVFGRANGTAPPASSYCWGVLVPSGTAPQAMVAFVWDYENVSSAEPVSLLLYVIPFSVANATSSAATLYGIPVSTWLTAATLGAIGSAVALAAYGTYRYATARSRPTPPSEP